MKLLIVTHGYFGDIMFASSLAKKFKETYTQIDYLIGFPQMKRLIENNPFINNVYVSNVPSPTPRGNQTGYDRVITLPALNYIVTPCEEYQMFAGIPNPTKTYQIYTSPEYDQVAKHFINELRSRTNKLVIGVMANWQPKTYLFTPEQYAAGIDVPNLGYGGSNRNVQYIVDELHKHFTLYPIGFPASNQQQTSNIADNDTKSLLFEASILKYCNAFVGTEGGLANLAAGVGCKTILTGDFIHQLYGPNGVLRKIENPQLGPDKYFPKVGHLMINPYFTDKEVVEQIIKDLQ
jgi:hypothetical protein